MVKRYAPFSLKQSIQGECLECTDGNYVTYEDYQNLQEQLGKAEEIILNLSCSYAGNYDDCPRGKCWKGCKGDIDSEPARQYFKEKDNP